MARFPAAALPLLLCVGAALSGGEGFVAASPSGFTLDGAPFTRLGANCYYLSYKPRAMVEALLDDAAAMNLGVVRMWAFLDRGSLDGSIEDVHGPADGVWFQAWDPQAGQAVWNDGANGLGHLDAVVAEAAARGLKLTLVLTNNWRDFGGVDQYCRWFGLARHDLFYTDARCKAAYKAWAEHLIMRVNPLTGLRYRDDPTILAWELINEPRRSGSNPALPHSPGLSSQVITDWAREMSDHIRGLDPNHLIAVGDEGFVDTGAGAHTADHLALSALPAIDFTTFHLYPEHWSFPAGLADDWIRQHIAYAEALGKPAVLEEYGLGDEAARDATYARWNGIVRDEGGAGAWFWMLAGSDGAGGVYPDYDGFTIYRTSATAGVVSGFAPSPNRPPRARLAGPAGTVLSPAAAAAFDAGASSDPDGDALAMAWDFGDGTTGTGSAASHVYRPGSYVASVRVSDPGGRSARASLAVTVAHSPPGLALPASLADPLAAPVRRTISAEGFDVVLAASNLPPGLAMTADGLITGSVMTHGTWQVAVTATNPGGTATGSFAYRIEAARCGPGAVALLLVPGLLALRPRRRRLPAPSR